MGNENWQIFTGKKRDLGQLGWEMQTNKQPGLGFRKSGTETIFNPGTRLIRFGTFLSRASLLFLGKRR